jgi:hypothetical protein
MKKPKAIQFDGHIKSKVIKPNDMKKPKVPKMC